MKPSRILLPLIVLLTAVILAGCAPKAGQIPTAALPAGKAWAEGKEIYFVHTEASDAGVAEKLTNMMKSPVLLVPSLAKMPADALAQVYVFTNGVAGKGPFGFQSDVFPNPPGTDGYSPLRNINAVTWADPAKARAAQVGGRSHGCEECRRSHHRAAGRRRQHAVRRLGRRETLSHATNRSRLHHRVDHRRPELPRRAGRAARRLDCQRGRAVGAEPAGVRAARQGGYGAAPQQLQPRASRPILLFLTAKLIAYTLLGFMLGRLGSVLQLTPMMRAILLTAIGIFMVGNALRMLNVHPIFRYFIIEPPSSVTRYIRRNPRARPTR